MTELFTHTLDVPTWFAIFVVCLLFWLMACAYAWCTAAMRARAVIEMIAMIGVEEVRVEKDE